MSGSVAAVIIVLGLAAIAAIVYLFRIGALGKAKGAIKVPVGAFPLTFEIELQSKERQISEKHFNMVDTNKFYVDSGVGFVIHKPFSEEWAILKPLLRELYKGKGYTEEIIDSMLPQIEDPDANVHILIIRRGMAQSIKLTNETVINDRQLDSEMIQVMRQKFQNGEELNYDQITVCSIRKSAIKPRIGLVELFLLESIAFIGLGPKKISNNPENTVFLLDSSAAFKKIEYNGELGDHIINNMMLIQESDEYFILVIVSYCQADDKPTKVWDELREYLKTFQVLVR